MIRVGVIGYGKMGQIRSKNAISDGRAMISKVFDEHFAAPPEFTVAASVEEIIADPDIDAVFICVPNHMNFPLTVAALNSGKHVFCEKPPCFNAAEMREIIACERRSGRVLMYGFNHRHHESILKARELITSGQYGKVIWLRGRYGKSVDKNFLSTWRADLAQAGGGILLDQGIHMLDLFLYLSTTSFDEVHAIVSGQYWYIPGVEDNVFAIMRDTRTGISASLHSTMTQWRHLFSLEIFLERGYLVINGLRTSSGTYGDEVLTIAKNRTTAPAATWEDEERFNYQVDASWANEAKMFLDAIDNGGPVASGSSADALQVMELIDTIYARGGRPSMAADGRN